MLQQLRKYSKSPVASVVIGILVLAFALWGVADIFRGGGDTVVADVGSSQISDAQYDLLLESGYSVQGFYALTGQDIVRRQMVDAIADGMAAPPGLARLLYDFFNEKRTAEYVVVTPEEAGQVAEPSASDLEAYHKAHAYQFSSPEYRAFDYVQI